MKKILFLFALVMATAFVSCGNKAANETDNAVVEETDSIANVDSTATANTTSTIMME